MIKFINSPSELKDFYDIAREQRFPFWIETREARPIKGEDDQWQRSNAFFHTGIVRTYARLSGYNEQEAREDLQLRFARAGDYEEYYEVESISGMSLTRLQNFITQCQTFLMQTFGEMADPNIEFKDKVKHIGK